MQANICDEIKRARGCGVTHCHLIKAAPMPLAKLVSKFSLYFTPTTYRKISKAQARVLTKRILHRDLAYNGKAMSAAKAEALTHRFFECFDGENVRYYTNGDFYTDNASHSWNPATSATFDTGILVMGNALAGCFWVEDED